jgi:hypothetical protein
MNSGRGRLTFVIAGAVTGFVVTALAPAHVGEGGVRIVQYVATEWMSAGTGTIAGALCGFLVWMLCSPRQRIATNAVVLAILNCAAWLLFLAANPRVSDGGASILAQRAQLDGEAAQGWPHGMTFTDHPSTLLAGRLLTWVDLSQKPLGVFSGPAVVFVHEQIVPERYWQTGATVTESEWIAVSAFVLSTAWWVVVGSLVSGLKRRTAGASQSG